MATNDSTTEALMLLDRAHGTLDLLYTLENTAGGIETLCKGSLSISLDSVMMSISQAKEFLLSQEVNHA